MRRAARLLPALAALFFLGACTAQARSAPLFGNTADDYGWGADFDSETAQLVFAVPESEVLWFGFYCRPGSGRVEFTDYGPTADALTLVSGPERTVAKVQRESDPLFEEIGNGELAAETPLLAAFQRTGRLGLAGDARSADGYSAGTAEEMAAIDRFFSPCRRTTA